MLGKITEEAKTLLIKVYTKAATAAENKNNVDTINHLANRYNAMREFAIACELLSFQDCENLEYVADNNMKFKNVTGVSPMQTALSNLKSQHNVIATQGAVLAGIQPTGKVSDLNQLTCAPATLKKLDDIKSEGFYASLQHDPQKQLAQDLHKELENLVIKGLEWKGYTFTNTEELKSFVATYCKVVTDVSGNRTYFVKNEPFFYHRPNLEVYTETKNNTVIMTANNGSYSFL